MCAHPGANNIQTLLSDLVAALKRSKAFVWDTLKPSRNNLQGLVEVNKTQDLRTSRLNSPDDKSSSALEKNLDLKA